MNVHSSQPKGLRFEENRSGKLSSVRNAVVRNRFWWLGVTR